MDAENALLLIRADAGLQIGTGHVMRCLALAQAWQEAGGRTHFVMALDAPSVAARLTAEGMEITRISARPGTSEDAQQTVIIARQRKASWVMLDGYHFGVDYQLAIKQTGLCLLLMDDNGHAGHYYADVVLNQNIYADESLYPNREPYTHLLLGSQYVLLRREFLPWRGWKRENPEIARKVLVTLGGGDDTNMTLNAIEALEQVDVDGLEVVVVIGGGNPHRNELQSVIQDLQLPIRVESNATNMADLMAWSEVAIAGSGTTCWEVIFMGLPSVILVLAENQKWAARILTEKRILLGLGIEHRAEAQEIAEALRNLMLNHEMRQEFSHNHYLLVDGLGVNRVTDHMCAL